MKPSSVFVLVFVLSALYIAKDLKRGWIPYDEGALAQSAERVLQGQVPHQDFDEIYTGGLSYLNASAFRVFGTKLSSLRYVLYLFSLAWISSLYYSASQFVSPPVAGVVTLLAVVWGVPNYSAAMPSWYNLFFASFGIASMLRYLKVGNRFWLFVAGMCGGISFLFKLAGLFFIAGVLLFFLFPEESVPYDRPSNCIQRNIHRALLLTSVISYVGLLMAFIRGEFTQVSFCYFVVPEIAVGVTLIWFGFASRRQRSPGFVALLQNLAVFGCGVAIPVVVFLAPYITGGTVSQFLYGVFVLPAKRFSFASYIRPPHSSFIGFAIDLALIAVIFFEGPRFWKGTAVLVLLSAPILLITARLEIHLYRTLWTATWALLPIVVILGLVLLIDKSISGEIDSRRAQQVFLLLSVTAACSLIQFPFNAPIYFCYVAPLLALTSTGVLSMFRRLPRLAVAGLSIFFISFAVLEVTPGFVFSMGQLYEPDVQDATLGLPRAGSLRVNREDQKEYTDLDAIVLKHAHGPYLYCTPDCPEVYFLFGFRNPGRTLFDFFQEPEHRTTRILADLQHHNVNLVILNENPSFSGPVPSDLRTALEQVFPNHASTQRFEVRWRP